MPAHVEALERTLKEEGVKVPAADAVGAIERIHGGGCETQIAPPKL